MVNAFPINVPIHEIHINTFNSLIGIKMSTDFFRITTMHHYTLSDSIDDICTQTESYSLHSLTHTDTHTYTKHMLHTHQCIFIGSHLEEKS